jgi:predicted nucleic acid-binding protein
VTAPGSRGAIVIDTDVFSADLVPTSRLAQRYAPIIYRPAGVHLLPDGHGAALRAIRRGWGEARMLKLDSKIRRAEVIHTGPELVAICAQLRADCAAIGHALAQREHNADRWIAATAIRLGIPLVSNDTIFKAVPGLTLESLA